MLSGRGILALLRDGSMSLVCLCLTCPYFLCGDMGVWVEIFGV